MINKTIDNSLYGCKGVVFAVFRHISPRKRHHARVKLTYKVGYFRYCDGRIGGLLG
jgi:hypothetical protein